MSKAVRKQPTRQARDTAALLQLDPELLAKRKKRRLDDLERTNFSGERDSLFEAQFDSVGGESSGSAKPTNRAREILSLKHDARHRKKSTAAVRAILVYRKPFNMLLEESGLADQPGPHYLTAVARPPKLPLRSLCQVCGYFGDYKCRKCGAPYCQISCRDTHNETGCERRLIA